MGARRVGVSNKDGKPGNAWRCCFSFSKAYYGLYRRPTSLEFESSSHTSNEGDLRTLVSTCRLRANFVGPILLYSVICRFVSNGIAPFPRLGVVATMWRATCVY